MTEPKSSKSLAEKSAENLENDVQKAIHDMLLEYRQSVSGVNDDCASYCESFFLKNAASRLITDTANSLLANVWNSDALFL